MKKLEVKICMGSSCYSRGNNQTLQILQKYLAENNLEDSVVLSGSLCECICNKGPNVFIDGTLYEKVDATTIIDLLNYHLKRRNL